MQAGADVHARREGDVSVLMCAAYKWTGEPEVVTLLLDAGADPNATDSDGTTPASFAPVTNRPAFEALVASHRGTMVFACVCACVQSSSPLPAPVCHSSLSLSGLTPHGQLAWHS